MIRLWIVLCFAVFFNACSRKEPPIKLTAPATPVLTSQSLWAVVNKPYIKVLTSSNRIAPIIVLMRKGDVAEILSRIGSDESDSYWVQVRLPEGIQGWVNNSDIDIYETGIQARTAGQELSSTMH